MVVVGVEGNTITALALDVIWSLSISWSWSFYELVNKCWQDKDLVGKDKGLFGKNIHLHPYSGELVNSLVVVD